jgi:hypothetical protein
VGDERSVIQPDDVLVASVVLAARVEARTKPLFFIMERGNGSITLPIVGVIRLEGKTVGEARETIREATAGRADDLTVGLRVYRDREK